jgi:hypothetical protein
MTAMRVAILLAVLDIGAVAALCISGDFISAVGMTIMGIICLGGGLVGQVQYGQTISTSA